jgi:hypothetical protein
MSGHVRTSATLIATCTAFPSPSPPCHALCTSHVPSLVFLPHLPLPSHRLSRLPCAHFGTSAALPRGWSAFHFFVCSFRGTVGIALFCTFQRAQKQSNLAFLKTFDCMSFVHHSKPHQKHDNRINSVPTLYSRDLSTFQAALPICCSQRCCNNIGTM